MKIKLPIILVVFGLFLPFSRPLTANNTTSSSSTDSRRARFMEKLANLDACIAQMAAAAATDNKQERLAREIHVKRVERKNPLRRKAGTFDKLPFGCSSSDSSPSSTNDDTEDPSWQVSTQEYSDDTTATRSQDDECWVISAPSTASESTQEQRPACGCFGWLRCPRSR